MIWEGKYMCNACGKSMREPFLALVRGRKGVHLCRECACTALRQFFTQRQRYLPMAVYEWGRQWVPNRQTRRIKRLEMATEHYYSMESDVVEKNRIYGA